MKKLLATLSLTALLLLALVPAARTQVTNPLTLAVLGRYLATGQYAGLLQPAAMTYGSTSSHNATDGPGVLDAILIDPHFKLSGTSVVAGTYSATLADITGPGVVTGIFLSMDDNLFDQAWMLGALRLLVFNDAEATTEAASPGSGRPCVDAPVGYLFGSGFFGADHAYQNKSHASGANVYTIAPGYPGAYGMVENDIAATWGSSGIRRWSGAFQNGVTWTEEQFFHNTGSNFAADQTSGALYFKLPMPVGNRSIIKLVNDALAGGKTPYNVWYSVEYYTGATISPYRFHAKYRQEFPATNGSKMQVTPAINGSGHVVGLIGTSSAGAFGWEGDWYVEVDGQTASTAAFKSSGTEDFFRSGFFWSMGSAGASLQGNMTRTSAASAAAEDMQLVYKFWPIPIHFNSSFAIEGEHGDNFGAGLNQVTEYWGGVTMWYQIEPCTAVTVPAWAPATATAADSGRMPPSNVQIAKPALGLAWEAEAQQRFEDNKSNGSILTASVLSSSIANGTQNAMYGGYFVELDPADHAGGDDYGQFNYYIPSGQGLSTGSATLTVYFGANKRGGQYRVQYSTNGGASFTTWTCTAGCMGGGNPNDVDTYQAGIDPGTVRSNATGTISVTTNTINILRLVAIGQNAGSGDDWLVLDAWKVNQ